MMEGFLIIEASLMDRLLIYHTTSILVASFGSGSMPFMFTFIASGVCSSVDRVQLLVNP